MTGMHASGCVVCTILSLVAILSTPARPFSAAQGTRVEISDPGNTGLPPGWHRIELKEGIDQDNEIVLILSLEPSGKHHRYPARASGCGRSDVKVLSWKPSVTRQRDGSLQLELVATSARGCKVVATIPAIPGIEGSPVGTAGAPGKKAPTIEGSPVGTAGAPPKPGGARGRQTFEADAEFERLIVKARQALPQISCAGAPRNVQARLAPLQSALQDVANASSPSAAVQPLRRFEAARQALQKALAGDRDTAAGAARCADAERRCAASSSIGSACGIDAGVCLARTVCSAKQ